MEPPARHRAEERGPSARRQREIEALRHQILDAAETILIEEGYDHLSMRRLAEAIEYAPSTLYGYFPDKKAILQAVIDRTTGYLLEALDRAATTPGPLTRLRMLGRAYVEFALEYPKHYEVLFLRRGPTVPLIVSPAFTAAVDHFREAVIEGVKKGVFRRLNPEETAEAFWAGCHGLVGLLLTHRDRYEFADPQRLLESLLTLQIEGLRPQAFGLTAPAHPVTPPLPAAPDLPVDETEPAADLTLADVEIEVEGEPRVEELVAVEPPAAEPEPPRLALLETPAPAPAPEPQPAPTRHVFWRGSKRPEA